MPKEVIFMNINVLLKLTTSKFDFNSIIKFISSQDKMAFGY